jgi:hypothetical protein
LPPPLLFFFFKADWTIVEEQLNSAVSQYTANHKSISDSRTWSDVRAAAARVTRARQRADAAKETFIRRSVAEF